MPELPKAPLAPRVKGMVDGMRLLAGGKLRTPGAVVFAFHDIGDDPSNSTGYYISPARFRQQLQYAMEWGLRFVDLGQLAAAVISGQHIDGLGCIVFDDSLVGVHHHALPVLVDLGLPATVFTVSDALGSTPAWWDGAARVMTRQEVEEVASAGLRIASHTRTHPSLLSLGSRAIQDEIAGSKSQLEDLVGREMDLFAYPFGHHDRCVRDQVAGAGYRAGFSFLNGRVTADLDRFRLPRLNMLPGLGAFRLAYNLARSPASWPDTQLDTVVAVDSETGRLEQQGDGSQPTAGWSRGPDHESRRKGPHGI